MTLDRSDILSLLEETLQTEGEVTVPSAGLSMGRRMAGADALVIRHAAPAEVRFGSIVAYRSGGRWVAHRVIWRFGRDSGWLAITKGDGNPGPDLPFLAKRDMVGLVVAMHRGDRIIRLDGGLSRIASVGAALTGLASVAAYSFLRGLRRRLRRA